MTKKFLVGVLGARMHYAVPRILYNMNCLAGFYTDFYIGNKPRIKNTLKRAIKVYNYPEFRRILDRDAHTIPNNLVTSFDLLGLLYARARRKAKNSHELNQTFLHFSKRFNEKIVQKGFGSADGIWGFNTASLEMFQSAKYRSLDCILEQTILPAYLENQLMSLEKERWKGWQPGLTIHPQNMLEREFQEWDLADRIVVGSEFVAAGLRKYGVDKQKISVIPYGVDQDVFVYHDSKKAQGRRLKILFAGEVGLRKGVPYLLCALQKLGSSQVEAKFAGNIAIQHSVLSQFSANAQFLGSIPRSKMPELYEWADVLVLPTLVEGSATAVYEAQMAGVAVVTTPNAGSIITDGVTGSIIPVCDIDGISDALQRYCDDPDLLKQHQRAAHQLKHYVGFQRYTKDIKNMLRDNF